MGYTTSFEGRFDLSRCLTVEEYNTLKEFNEKDHRSERYHPDSYHCQWVPTEDGKGIEWDEGEKFYRYTEWLEVLIDRYFEPWGIVVSGSVKWAGEDNEDMGIITVDENAVSAKEAIISWAEDEPEGKCPTCGAFWRDGEVRP